MEPTATLDFQKDVFHALECPVCLEIVIPPVTLCKLGHFICGICRKKLNQCVICKNEYTDLRCYAVENIASKINAQCPYKPCKIRESIAKLEEHLKRCDYRPVVCNCDNENICVNKPIEFDKYVGHLKEAHGATSSTKISQYLISDDEVESEHISLDWGHLLYTCDGVSFIRNLVVEDSIVFCWIWAMLPESLCSNYVADIHIGQKDMVTGKINSDKKNIRWTVGVVPPHVSLADMKCCGDCVTFPASRLMSLCETHPIQEGTFIFSVELKLRKL